jgi:hypothetical protein
MTDLRAAAQQALEALDTLYRTLTPETPLAKSLKQRADTLRAALAEPVEPVAWGVFGANLHDMFFTEEEAHEMAMLKGDGSTVAPLYTSPPPRQPLTKESLLYLYNQLPNWGMDMDSLPRGLEKFARAIEQAHGIGSKT